MSGMRTVGMRGAWIAAAALLFTACDSGSGPYTFEADGETDSGVTAVHTPPPHSQLPQSEATPDAQEAEPVVCDTDTALVAAAIDTAAPEGSGVVLATSPNCEGFRWILVSTGATGPNAPATAPRAPRHVLLFDGDTYLGPAASVPAPYTEVIGQSPETIVVRYRWTMPGDPEDQPTGGPADVRYQLSAGGVIALDPVPTIAAETAAATAAAAGCVNAVDPAAVAAAITVLPPAPNGSWQPGATITGCQELGWAVVNSPESPAALGASHVLFFADGRYVGTATNDPLIDPFVEGNPTTDTVAVIIGADDPNGPATVRFGWDGIRLLTLETTGG